MYSVYIRWCNWVKCINVNGTKLYNVEMWRVHWSLPFHLLFTFAYFTMTDLGGERTCWNCEMCKVHITSTLLRITSTFLHITSTFLHITSTFIIRHPHSSTLHLHSSTLHLHFQFWNVAGPHYIHIFNFEMWRVFNVDMWIFSTILGEKTKSPVINFIKESNI